MHYKLNSQYILRGWTNLPYCLVNTTNGECETLNPIVFQTLSLCNGITDMDGALIPSIYRNIVKQLEENNVIEKCKSGDESSNYQSYKEYDCRHIGELQWSITGKCNYRCRHCYMSAPDAKYGELSLEQCLEIINQIEEAGIFQVMLTGGEPLVRKDFFTIVDALSEKNISIKEIYSNGRLINENLLDKFENRHIKPVFSISFDGVEWHDWLRGIPGAEKDAIRAFSILQKRGFVCDVEMSLHKLNLNSIENTVKLLADLGIRQLKISPTSDSGKWMNEGGKYTLTTQELYNAYLNYVKTYKESGAPINLMLGGFFRCSRGSEKYSIPAMKFDGTEDMQKQPLCGSAHNRVYIAADGKVLPCIPLSGLPIQEIFPNIQEQRLAEILTGSEYSKLIESQLKDLLAQNPKCAACEWKYVCGGGCRAGALLSNQGYMGCDETICYFFKENYQAKIAGIYNNFI